MGNIFFGLMTLAVLVAVAYFVIVATEMRTWLKTTSQALKDSQEHLTRTLDELRQTLQSTRHVTDNMGIIIADARDVAESAREVSNRVRTVGKFVENFTSLPALQASALKLGIRTAVRYAVKHFFGTSQKT
jgi:uncharacterized protein YoxC